MPLNPTETQSRIIRSGLESLLVQAGPGSGKTYVIAERIRYLLSQPEGHFHVLGLTFTNKAAGEMKRRLSEFPDLKERSYIGTIHGFCSEVLRERGGAIGLDPPPTILESFNDQKALMYRAIESVPGLRIECEQRFSHGGLEKTVENWLSRIGEAKRGLLAKSSLVDPQDDPFFPRVFEVYRNLMRSMGLVDFDDLLLFTRQLFLERPKIAGFFRKLYRFICVDEAQDLNEAQYQVLYALCCNDRAGVLMVGDPRQAIFGWGGADPGLMKRFVDDFSASTIHMPENFRSAQRIVDAARILEPTYEADIRFPVSGEIFLIEGETEKDEAIAVLDRIDTLLRNGHPDLSELPTLDQCAILARNRFALRAMIEELEQRKWPHFLRTGSENNSDSDLFHLCERVWKILANPRDDLHRTTTPSRFVAEPPGSYEGMDQGLNDFLATLPSEFGIYAGPICRTLPHLITPGNCDFFGFLETLQKEVDGFSSVSDQDRELIVSDGEGWKRRWELFLRSRSGGSPSLGQFLTHVALGMEDLNPRKGLALLTVHSAKGLEFNIVAIIGMTEGVFPDYRANTPEKQAEETRNAFVAITRAKRILLMSRSRQRLFRRGPGQVNPSPFLLRLLRAFGTTNASRTPL